MQKVIRQIADELKASPMFNLSLSSKELFHSNFLYWIGNNEEPEMRVLFEHIVQELTDDRNFHFGKELTVKREKGNTDVSVEGEIIIENKVKSIPYAYQLAKYRDENNSCKRFVLLSLFKADNFDGWITKSYKDLYDAIDESIIENPYYKAILADYKKFILNLHEISLISGFEGTEHFPYEDNKDIYEILTEIRVADFYLKAKYASIASEIYKNLTEIYPDLKLKIARNKSIVEIGKDDALITIGHGFTRAQGLFEIKFKTKNFVFLIQVQGGLYRRGFESWDNTKMPPDNIRKEEIDWVNFKDFVNEVMVYPQKGDNTTFNKYGETFKYKSIKVPEITSDELISRIIEDCKICLELVAAR